MRFLAELVYLRRRQEKSWPKVGKLFWRQANMLGMVMLNGVPFPCDANRFSSPQADGIRLIGRAKDSESDPLPFVQGDLIAKIPTWESDKSPCHYAEQWCGYITSGPSKEADGLHVIYTVILEIIPVVWTREFRGLWLEVRLDELQDQSKR